MPKKLRKSLKIYLSKLKKIPTPPSATALLSTCKYPKTPSFDRRHGVADDGAPPTSATLADVDRFLFENFHSLYLDRDDDATATDGSGVVRPSSDRFFVSPGRTSSSLVATTASSSPSSTTDLAAVPTYSVAVMTLSKDPYKDFRRSMKEMVKSRHDEETAALDWDFMEELLFCYLELNDRAVHQYILKAFTDLTASFQRKNVPSAERRRRRRKVHNGMQEDDNHRSTCAST